MFVLCVYIHRLHKRLQLLCDLANTHKEDTCLAWLLRPQEPRVLGMASCDDEPSTTSSASSPTAAAAAHASAMITLPTDQSPTAPAAEAKSPSFSSGTRRLGRGLGSFKLYDCTDDWQEEEEEAEAHNRSGEPTGAHLLQPTASVGAPIAGQARIAAWVRQSGLSLLPPPPLDKECRGRRNVLEDACYR